MTVHTWTCGRGEFVLKCMCVWVCAYVCMCVCMCVDVCMCCVCACVCASGCVLCCTWTVARVDHRGHKSPPASPACRRRRRPPTPRVEAATNRRAWAARHARPQRGTRPLVAAPLPRVVPPPARHGRRWAGNKTRAPAHHHVPLHPRVGRLAPVLEALAARKPRGARRRRCLVPQRRRRWPCGWSTAGGGWRTGTRLSPWCSAAACRSRLT